MMTYSKLLLATVLLLLLVAFANAQESVRRSRQVTALATNEATVAINQQFA